MTSVREHEDMTHSSESHQRNGGRMICVREEEDEIQAENRCHQNLKNMVSARELESENESSCRNRSKIEAVKRCRRLPKNHVFSSDRYLDVGRTDWECTHSGTFHFVDDNIKTSTGSQPSFSTY